MDDKTFIFLTILVCSVVLGVPVSIGGYLINGWSLMIFAGFVMGAVFGEVIAVGVYGLGKIHEREDQEREEYAQQKVAEAKKEWKKTQSVSD